MTDENQNNDPKPNEENNNPLDKFEEIKTSYEKTIEAKDKEIEELRKQLTAKEGEVDDTITKLNSEVNEKLQKSEELKKLQADIHKYSRLGDKDNLKKATEAYNKLNENATVKFLTDYDKKVPMGSKLVTSK